MGVKFPLSDDITVRDCRWKYRSPLSLSRILMLTFSSHLFMLISNNWISFVFKYDLWIDMSKWLNAGRTHQIISCFGNSFSAETRGSFLCNKLSPPALVPYIHSEYSLIFPFEASPNNMTTFSCALSEPSVRRIAVDRLSVSLSPIFHNMGTRLRQLLKVCWSLSFLLGLTVFAWDTPDGIPHCELF